MSLGGDLSDFISTYVSGVSGRVYYLRLPQTVTLPAITYQRISGAPGMAHDGPHGVDQRYYQVDIWDTSPDNAVALEEVLKAAMNGYSGAMGGSSISLAALKSEREDYDPETGFYRIILEWLIQFLT